MTFCRVIRSVLMLTCITLLAGCMTTYHNGIKPISPDVGNPEFATTVDSLTPTFKWESKSAGPNVRYDFAIWDIGTRASDLFFMVNVPVGGSSDDLGPVVYLKENLAIQEHTLDVPLAPNSIYLWSVRTRINGNFSGWSTYNHWNWIMSKNYKNWYYIFRTPKTETK